MTKSSYRRSNKPPARRTRRMQTLAVGVMPRPSILGKVWNHQRPKLAATGLLALITVAMFVLFDTDLFFVYNLQISGARYLAPEEINKASSVIGYNIFFVNSRDVERALAKLPEVKAARVSANLPNQVTVEIDERSPQLTWQRGNETYWIDLDGIALRARKNLAELPSVRDLDQAPLKLGQGVKPDALAAFWAFRAAYPEGPSAYDWTAARGLQFTDERGWKIYLGDADEMAGKIAKLRALTAQLVAQKAQIKFIDLGKGDPYYQ